MDEGEVSILKHQVESGKKDIESLKKENQLIRERQEADKPNYMQIAGMLGSAMFVLTSMASSLIWFVVSNEVESVKETSGKEIAFLTARIDDIKERKIRENLIQDAALASHASLPGHPATNERLVEIDQRVLVIESDIKDDEGVFAKLNTDLTRLSGLVERAHLLISSNTAKSKDTHALAIANQARLGSVAASTESGFVEVETQLRSILEVLNVRWQGMKTLQALMWQKVFEKNLPEEDFFPQNIPAAATSATGRINGNGH